MDDTLDRPEVCQNIQRKQHDGVVHRCEHEPLMLPTKIGATARRKVLFPLLARDIVDTTLFSTVFASWNQQRSSCPSTPEGTNDRGKQISLLE
jgi:hypothetical protein